MRKPVKSSNLIQSWLFLGGVQASLREVSVELMAPLINSDQEGLD